MKYIVVGMDKKDQTMWVLHGIYTTRHDALSAKSRNQIQEIHPERYMYEVCDIAEKELDLFRDYAELQAPPVDVPAQRTEDFSMDELFGRGFGERYSDYESNTGEHEWYTKLCCKECGAGVISPSIHHRWHNKLLP